MIGAPMTSLSPPIQSVLELFKGPLSGVRFADIDATGLASLAAEVESAASEVQRQEAQLAELRQALAQRQEALLVLAQQALAYARVYAENDEPLLEELNRISLPRAAKPRKPSAAKPSAARSEATQTLPEVLEVDGEATSTDVSDVAPQRAVRKGRRPASQPSAG
jgi:hypothetical protein